MMGYTDRQRDEPWSDHEGRGGKWSRFFARLVENPDNPVGWSIYLFTFRRIEVRIHLATILFMVSMLLWSIPRANYGVGHMAWTMAALFIVVLLHEFGHCFACRAVGGEADRVVMLPFGGVALAIPPDNWRANLVTTAGGPAVNVGILALTAPTLALLGQSQLIVFNPLHPHTALLGQPAFEPYWLLMGIFWFHVTNAYILMFNLVLLMYPFDGGRIVQALMWARMGYRRSMEWAVNIGFLGAMILGILAATLFDEVTLVLIAIFGAMACWSERQRLRAGHDLVGGGGDDPILAAIRRDEREADAERRREERADDRKMKDEQELDRLLSKISASGMDSLSSGEKRALARLSQQKRGS